MRVPYPPIHRNKKFSSIGKDLTDEIFAGETYHTQKRKVSRIAIHCSASPQGRGDDAFTIDRWHVERWGKLSGIGYHYVVLEDGTIQKGRWVDSLGAGVYRGNSETVHICYIGGSERDEITEAQLISIERLSALLISEEMYSLRASDIKGHNEFEGHSSRGCPNTDVDHIRREVLALTFFDEVSVG